MFKLVGFPTSLYGLLRQFSETEGTTNRSVIKLAVDRHLPSVLAHCAEAGLAPSEGERKLVRTAVDPAVKAHLDEKAEESGVDATTLLLACLRHELGLRLVDSERKSLLARLKRRLTKR